MERAVLMLKPEQRTKLADLAARERVSTAEIHRRAIDAYNPDMGENSELEQLADIAIQSHQQVMEHIKQARAAVKESLAYFKDKQNGSNHER